ncbi:hypothetical protein BV898_11911 [Hypsibius exemplaris]|uniref:Uncharacterized protein n=1 Tax=Hypsibius exemplaris TaxID=2072580 RepID=A0A1W0WFG1_HYPEX|nr:hypothetical protein BV898_11911 [Hypsibius exemplaris]
MSAIAVKTACSAERRLSTDGRKCCANNTSSKPAQRIFPQQRTTIDQLHYPEYLHKMDKLVGQFRAEIQSACSDSTLMEFTVESCHKTSSSFGIDYLFKLRTGDRTCLIVRIFRDCHGRSKLLAVMD